MSTKMSVSRFRDQCLVVLDRVEQTGASLTITKYGRAVAKIVPVRHQKAENSASGPFGVMRGTIEINGNLLVSSPEAWTVEAK